MQFKNKNRVNIPDFIKSCFMRTGLVKKEKSTRFNGPTYGFYIFQHIKITKIKFNLIENFWFTQNLLCSVGRST